MQKPKIFHKTIGVIFIVFGVVFYLTPVPGTTILIILGFVFLVGKERTLNFFKRIFSHKMFTTLRIKSILEKM